MPTVCQALRWSLGRQQGVRDMTPAPMGHVAQQDRQPLKEHPQHGISSEDRELYGRDQRTDLQDDVGSIIAGGVTWASHWISVSP